MSLVKPDPLTVESLEAPGELIRPSGGYILPFSGVVDGKYGIAMSIIEPPDKLSLFKIPDRQLPCARGLTAARGQALAVRTEIYGKNPVNEWALPIRGAQGLV